MEQFVAEVRGFSNVCSQAIQALSDAQTSRGTGSDLSEAAKILQKPDIWRPSTLEDEIAQWPEWSFLFKSFLVYGDQAYKQEFDAVENALDTEFRISAYSEQQTKRARKLFAVLTSYLKGRPLRIVRGSTQEDGYVAWQALCRELQPSSRQRSVALAQTILSFPQFEKGKTLDGLLAFEKLIEDYERVSGTTYNPELKMGTLLRCLHPALRQHLQLNLTRSTTYQQMRNTVVTYEQTTAAWTTNKIMAQFQQSPTQPDHYGC